MVVVVVEALGASVGVALEAGPSVGGASVGSAVVIQSSSSWERSGREQ